MYRNGDIAIFGWYYIIETGEVFNYSGKDESCNFLKLSKNVDQT